MQKTLSTEQKEQIFRLRKVREDLGLSQEQFANVLGIGISSYKKTESYERQISMSTLTRLHSKLHISADYILFDEKTGQEQAWAEVLNCSEADKMIVFLRLFHYFTMDKPNIFPVEDDQAKCFEEAVRLVAAGRMEKRKGKNPEK